MLQSSQCLSHLVIMFLLPCITCRMLRNCFKLNSLFFGLRIDRSLFYYQTCFVPYLQFTYCLTDFNKTLPEKVLFIVFLVRIDEKGDEELPKICVFKKNGKKTFVFYIWFDLNLHVSRYYKLQNIYDRKIFIKLRWCF